MHSAPRFGHSNHLGLILSSNPDAPMMYANGLKQFTIFTLIPFIIWGTIILIFKCGYGIDRVGCAAGGEALDMYQLSTHSGLNRRNRKKRILRSWRLQSTFMVCSLLIPVVTTILIHIGFTNVTVAMEELKELVDDIESLAYRGWTAVQGLEQNLNHLLNDNEIVVGIIPYTLIDDGPDAGYTTNNTFDDSNHPNDLIDQMNDITGADFRDEDAIDSSSVFISEWCPHARDHMGDLLLLSESFQLVQDNANTLITTFDDNFGNGIEGTPSDSASNVEDAFMTVVETTVYIDSTMNWFLAHDWILKLILVLLNAVNILLLLSVYCLSKNNIFHNPTRAYLSWILVPLFATLAAFLLVFTLVTGITALVNADFCAGGSDPGSPHGTLEDVLLSVAQYGDLDRSAMENYLNGTKDHDSGIPEKLGMVYQAVNYYTSVRIPRCYDTYFGSAIG
jgi:hypothetical protein